MPSFDIASEVDIHNLTNAVDQSNRVVNTRFDFKGTEASFVREELTVQLTADAEFQAEQMIDILRAALIKCSVDPKAMQIQDGHASGKLYKQSVVFKNGLEADLARKIVKLIKEQKFKVQTQIQGEQVRVTGKKRDDLQEVMAMLREADLDQPLQFTNFRD